MQDCCFFSWGPSCTCSLVSASSWKQLEAAHNKKQSLTWDAAPTSLFQERNECMRRNSCCMKCRDPGSQTKNQLVLEVALWGHSIKPGLCRDGLWDCVLLPNAAGDLRNIPPPLWISNYLVRAGGDWTKWLMRFLPAQIVHSVNISNNPAQPVVFVQPPISHPSHCYWAFSPWWGCGGGGVLDHNNLHSNRHQYSFLCIPNEWPNKWCTGIQRMCPGVEFGVSGNILASLLRDAVPDSWKGCMTKWSYF